MFGQWLSGMAHIARSTDDADIRKKSAELLEEWAKTIGTDPGPSEHAHYDYDKLVGGLVDLHLYTGHPDALPLLRCITETARKHLPRARTLASPLDPVATAGGCEEWYTLSENLYRAYAATSDAIYKDFGDVWRYEAYWSRFMETARPAPMRVHAYSHTNTLGSAAMTYAVTGDQRYLRICRNAYDFMLSSQVFAPGGYGPGERLVGYDGELGRSLELHADSAEIPCGAWAAFKFCRQLIQYTGEARFGDWIERLMCNGIGAALPMGEGGRTFYYADYRLGSGRKSYLWDHWPCCSGTYIQCVAEYPNLIYFRDASSLYVNLFIPSEVTWRPSGRRMRVRQTGDYPEGETARFEIDVDSPFEAAIRFRVPEWATTANLKINGVAMPLEVRPSTWATIDRTWTKGDRVEVQLPMKLRSLGVDQQHPDRVALLYGPVVLVEDMRFSLGLQMPADHHSPGDVPQRLRPARQPLHFDVIDPDRQVIRSGPFLPYYEAAPELPYRMYHDLAYNEMRG